MCLGAVALSCNGDLALSRCDLDKEVRVHEDGSDAEECERGRLPFGDMCLDFVGEEHHKRSKEEDVD